MNATERIRAALERERSEARLLGETPPPAQPVEDSLGLLSGSDGERAAAVEDAPARGPAETVDLLRNSLGKAAREEAQASTVPAPVPAPANPAPAAHAPTPAAPAPVAHVPAPRPSARSAESDDDAATELRLWASEIPSQNDKRRVSPWIVAVAAVAVLAILGVVFRSVWQPWFSKTAPASVTALQLAVESEDSGLISLRWNPQSQPVGDAREGRLTITEDQKPPRIVSLTAGQLLAGHLFFESSSDRVEFQLEVTRKSGSVARESVLAAKKPAPSVATPNAATPNVEQAPLAQIPGAPPAPGTEAPKPVATPAPRTFTPPPAPATPDRAGEGRIILMEPAPTISGGSAPPTGVILPERANVIPPPQAPAAAPPKPQQRLEVGGRLQAAMLLHKIDPVYPQLARQMHIEGTVRFQAVIGKDGYVKGLKFVSGPRVLQTAASDAVKRWVYRPTLLDGRPVEVDTVIDLNFSLGH